MVRLPVTLPQNVRIVCFDRRDALPGKSEPGNNRIGHRDSLGKTGCVVERFCPQKKADPDRAIGKGRHECFESNLRHLVDGERQDIGRKPVAMPGEGIDQRAAVLAIMEQHNGIGAAGFTEGQEHCAQLVEQRVGRRQGIGCRTRRTGRGALATSGADLRADLDVIAIRRDRSGWAEVEAAMTAGQPRARMNADICGKIDVFRFVEAAHKVARAEHRAQHRSRISRIRAQIAVAQAMSGEERHPAGKIEHDVASRGQAVAGSLEHERIARGGAGSRIVIYRCLERSQMARCVADRPLDDRKGCRRRRHDLRRLCDHDCNVQVVGEQLACFHRNIVAAVDQDHPFAR